MPGYLVKAAAPSGKEQGTHTGMVAVRATGSFNIQGNGVVIQGISYKYCQKVFAADGYTYQLPEFLHTQAA